MASPSRPAMNVLSLKSAVRLSSGYSMPLLGFGVYQNRDAKNSVLLALKEGYRYSRILLGEVYRNEEHVGEAVRESGINRSEVFITTKCMSKTPGYQATLEGVDESLKKFGFDYVDLFLIHDPFGGKERRIEIYKALLQARDQGKIKSVGVSNFNVSHMEELRLAGLEAPTVNQVELHPLCQQKPIVKYCEERGIAVQAYCPIIRGQWDNPVIVEIAAEHARDPAQILLRWSLQRGYVPLPKSEKAERIRSNARLYDFELIEDEMSRLNALDRGKEGAISWNPVDNP